MMIKMSSKIKAKNKDPKVVNALINVYELQEEKLKRIIEKIDKNSQNRGLVSEEKREKV